MLLKSLVSLIVCALLLNNGECARILGIFTMPAFSHHTLCYKLMRGLSHAGHDVTMVSGHALKEKFTSKNNGTFTNIVLDGIIEDFEEMVKNTNVLSEKKTLSGGNLLTFMENLSNRSAEFMKHPKLQQLVASKPKFDLMISEYFFNDVIHAYADILDCPLVLLNSQGPTEFISAMVSNPRPVSYVSHVFYQMSKNFTFIERTINLAVAIIHYILMHLFFNRYQEGALQNIYPGSPSLYELQDRVELILLNSHSSINDAVPLVPNMIEIGGYFIDPPKKLPKDLQEFMDGAKEGVIYFSLGSNAKSKDMTHEKKSMFLNIFGRLKQKVIWKFEEKLPNIPSNVLIKDWCPQQDILAHPNMKLFITHGGLLSTTETIYHGVPILAIPIFADQHLNAAKSVRDGYALQLPYHDSNFTEERLEYLIKELLNDPKYQANVKQRSRLFHDRPMPPMETAVYWVNYIIRHGGAPHLKVAGINLPWYKYFMVDVIGFLILVILLILFSLKFAFKKIFKRPKTKVKTN
ncbi:UDP-glycosyltransferase UGT5-like [Euwallacea fornicatus]|uniref:UDP-glycosyltransferase UGT5-like n=1 Tax=Euwallacea fornicatus TaxID=995702 RepID=UPI00338FD7FF